LDREVDDGSLVLDIGWLKQASGSFHRTKLNLHTDLGEKRRVLVVEELCQRQNYASLTKNEKADVAVDASLNRFDPLARTSGDMLQDFRHHLWQKHFLEHLPAYDGANFRGDDGFRLNVDAYAE